MRLLVTCVGGRGHLDPLLPIATAAVTRGHTVTVAVERRHAATVRSAGLEVYALPEPPRAGGSSAAPTEPQALLAVDRRREEADLRDKFVAEAGRERCEVIRAAALDWDATAILTDEVDVGAVLAAELLGIPSMTVVVLLAGGFLRREVVGDAWDALRLDQGLAADQGMRAIRGSVVVDPAPPGYRDPSDPLAGDVVHVRLATRVTDPNGPPWTPVRPDRPAVYATLGTVFNAESGDLFERLVAAVARHDGDVLVTVGTELDPARFGDLPAHVHVERFVPQSQVLPHVAVVVTHAGSGSVLGALTHGLPMVLLPIGADQPWNGDRAAAVGVARVLDPIEATPDDIADAVSAVLDDPGYRHRAGELAAALAALPRPDAAVEALERAVAAQPA